MALKCVHNRLRVGHLLHATEQRNTKDYGHSISLKVRTNCIRCSLKHNKKETSTDLPL